MALACKEMGSLLLQSVNERFQTVDEKLDLVLGGMALLLGRDWQKIASSLDWQPDSEMSPACCAPPGLHSEGDTPRRIVFDRTAGDDEENDYEETGCVEMGAEKIAKNGCDETSCEEKDSAKYVDIGSGDVESEGIDCKEDDDKIYQRLEKLEQIFLLIDWDNFEQAVRRNLKVNVHLEPSLTEKQVQVQDEELTDNHDEELDEGQVEEQDNTKIIKKQDEELILKMLSEIRGEIMDDFRKLRFDLAPT